MNGERAQAYGRAIKAIDDLSAGKLHPREEDVVREAADALFFCDNLQRDPAAEQALADFDALVDRLIESERLIPQTGDRLTALVKACGPLAPVTA